jgi:E3 ubiquitin-protein ligase makorin
VTPSLDWPANSVEKTRIVEEYKEKLSKIDCRHYNKGKGSCPFSTSCFYRHVDEYGVSDKDKIRIISNQDYEDEGLKIMKQVSLADFL